MNTNVKVFIGIIILLILGTVLTVAARGVGPGSTANGEYDEFATCLKDSGALFYGAFWCPHCQSQKKIFGNSARLLPYIECSTADGRSQLPLCREVGVPSYPYWVFADGTTLAGEVSLETLAEKTSCALPGAESAATPVSLSESETESQISSPAVQP